MFDLRFLVGVVLTAGACVMLAGSFVLSEYALHPTCCTDELPSRAVVPEWAAFKGPADVGLNNSVDVTFPGRDGARVEGWLVPERSNVAKRGNLVVLVHDSGADQRQMLRFAQKIHKRIGWATLMFRTSEASNARAAFGTHAQYDVLGAINYARSNPHVTVHKIAVLGVSQGAAAAMHAMTKDSSVDAFVGVSMFNFASEFAQWHLLDVLGQLQHTTRGWANQVVRFVLNSNPSRKSTATVSEEEATFMNKKDDQSAGWILDIAAQLAVVYGAGFKAWLQGHADPHKTVHRIQPRSFMLCQSKTDPIQSWKNTLMLYQRAGSCNPKQAHILQEGGHEVDLRRDKEFWGRVRMIM